MLNQDIVSPKIVYLQCVPKTFWCTISARPELFSDVCEIGIVQMNIRLPKSEFRNQCHVNLDCPLVSVPPPYSQQSKATSSMVVVKVWLFGVHQARRLIMSQIYTCWAISKLLVCCSNFSCVTALWILSLACNVQCSAAAILFEVHEVILPFSFPF